MGRNKAQVEVPRVQVVPGQFGPTSATVCGLMAAGIAALLGYTVDGFQYWYPPLFAAAVVIAVWLARYKRKVRAVTAWFTSACMIVPSVWAAVTIRFGWSLLGVMLLLAFAVFAWVFATLCREKPAAVAAAVAAEAEAQAEADRDPQEAEIDGLLRDFLNTKRPPTVTKVKEWPKLDGRSTGDTWLLEGQRGNGFNYRWVTDFQVDMAAAMHLPPGCPVMAEPSNLHQGAALLHVSRINAMDRDIPFPVDYRMRSVRNGFPIGSFLDATDTEINLFQDTTLVNGQKGGGKSVLLQGATANSLFFNDSLTGIVDLSGRLPAPWMYLHATGEIPDSPLKFVAPTAATALELAAYLMAVVEDRSARYARMMILHDVDVLPVGNGRDMCMVCGMIHPPALQIFVDEGGEVMGDDADPVAVQAATLFRKIIRVGRAVAVQITLSTQRGTSDYVPAQVKKAISQMISLRVADESELSWLFGWKKGLSPDDLAGTPGKGYIQFRQGAVRMFKANRLLPAQIVEITRFVAQQQRAELEAPAVALGGRWLANYWQHPDLLAYMSRLRGDGSGGAQPEFDPNERIEVGAAGIMAQALRAVPPGGVVDGTAVDTAAPASPKASSPASPKEVLDMDEAALEERMADLEVSWSLSHGQVDDGDADVDVQGEVGTPDRQQVSSKAARREFIVKTVVAAGPAGKRTGDLVNLTIDAGLARRERPQTVKEDIGQLAKEQQIFQKQDEDGQPLTGWWVGPGYAAR